MFKLLPVVEDWSCSCLQETVGCWLEGSHLAGSPGQPRFFRRETPPPARRADPSPRPENRAPGSPDSRLPDQYPNTPGWSSSLRWIPFASLPFLRMVKFQSQSAFLLVQFSFESILHQQCCPRYLPIAKCATLITECAVGENKKRLDHCSFLFSP